MESLADLRHRAVCLVEEVIGWKGATVVDELIAAVRADENDARERLTAHMQGCNFVKVAAERDRLRAALERIFNAGVDPGDLDDLLLELKELHERDGDSSISIGTPEAIGLNQPWPAGPLVVTSAAYGAGTRARASVGDVDMGSVYIEDTGPEAQLGAMGQLLGDLGARFE